MKRFQRGIALLLGAVLVLGSTSFAREEAASKSATATARLYKGKGEITINNKPALEYLSGNKTFLVEITDPLALAEKKKDLDITIIVKGGGLSG